MGTAATIDISEESKWTRIVPDRGPKIEGASYSYDHAWGKPGAQPWWWDLERRGFLHRIVPAPEMDYETGKRIGCYESVREFNYALPGGLNKPPHQPHLENFFAAIRGEAVLNCDARTAFLSEAPVYFIDSAARNHQPINYTPEQLTP